MGDFFVAQIAATGALVLSFGLTAQGAQPVLQRGYNPGVSGATLSESTLNTTNVSQGTFGLVFKLPFDDNVYAQPLYMPSVAIPNQGTHNVVYVATMSDTLYAFAPMPGARRSGRSISQASSTRPRCRSSTGCSPVARISSVTSAF